MFNFTLQYLKYYIILISFLGFPLLWPCFRICADDKIVRLTLLLSVGHWIWVVSFHLYLHFRLHILCWVECFLVPLHINCLTVLFYIRIVFSILFIAIVLREVVQLARKFLPSSNVFILLDKAEDFLIATNCLWDWEEGEVLGIHGEKQ